MNFKLKADWRNSGKRIDGEYFTCLIIELRSIEEDYANTICSDKIMKFKEKMRKEEGRLVH